MPQVAAGLVDRLERDAARVGQAGRFHEGGVLLVGARAARRHRRDDHEVIGVVVLDVARAAAGCGGLQRDQRARVQREALVGATWRGVVGDREIGAVAVGVGAVGQADVAPPGATGAGGEAAALACSGGRPGSPRRPTGRRCSP